jgi:hypothetical protein
MGLVKPLVEVGDNGTPLLMRPEDDEDFERISDVRRSNPGVEPV